MRTRLTGAAPRLEQLEHGAPALDLVAAELASLGPAPRGALGWPRRGPGRPCGPASTWPPARRRPCARLRAGLTRPP